MMGPAELQWLFKTLDNINFNLHKLAIALQNGHIHDQRMINL